MEDNILFKLKNKICSNNNDILLNVISKLENIINDSKSDVTVQRIKDIIIILNNIIEQNKKNTKEIIDYIAKLDKNINNNFKEIKNIIINKFVGQNISKKREGKKIQNFKSGNRYEDDFKNDKRRGKGISGLNSSFEFPRHDRFGRQEFMKSNGPPGTIQQEYEPLGLRGVRFKKGHGSLDKYRGYGRPKKPRNRSFDVSYGFDGPLNGQILITIQDEFRGPHELMKYRLEDSNEFILPLRSRGNPHRLISQHRFRDFE